MKTTTAIILTSGFGTRMLPVTTAIQKELLPVLNRPTIDYVVSDCVAAGIKRILFVIRGPGRALRDYYVGRPDLEDHLERHRKTAELALLRQIHDQATYEFIDQSGDAYGSAVPVQQAASHLADDEAFLVCGGDDFLWRTDGGSEIADLIDTFNRTEAEGAILTQERPEAELHRYGVLDLRTDRGVDYLGTIVEKPAPGQAPSRLVNLSKYVLTPQILKYILEVKPNPRSHEFYITDAITAAAQHHAIAVHRATGEYLDTGSVESWLHANLTVARDTGLYNT